MTRAGTCTPSAAQRSSGVWAFISISSQRRSAGCSRQGTRSGQVGDLHWGGRLRTFLDLNLSSTIPIGFLHLVMLEAAAASVPIVCVQRSGSAEEFVENGGGIAVPCLDVEAVAQAAVRYRGGAAVTRSRSRAAWNRPPWLRRAAPPCHREPLVAERASELS